MLRCKHVSDALHKQDYTKLPKLKRLGLLLHVKLCVFCGRAQKEVMTVQDTCRTFRENEEQETVVDAPSLKKEVKSDLQEQINQKLSKLS